MAGEGEEDDAAKSRNASDGSNPSSSKPRDKDKLEKKRPKSRVKIFSAKEGVSSPFTHYALIPLSMLLALSYSPAVPHSM